MSIEVTTKEPLSEDIIETLKSQVSQRGAKDFVEITSERINFHSTFNHGYDKALSLLASIEPYVSANVPVEIGELKTEAIEGYIPTIYLFRDKIIFVSVQRINAMYCEFITYLLRDLHGHEHNIDSDNFKSGTFLDKAIQEFAAKQL